MKFFSLVFTLLASISLHAQIISQFTWDSGGPVTVADVGPDAISVSGSAISDVGGVGGTNGLNAGLPKQDIQMVIPGSPVFDVAGIDVSFDYHREESIGTFWRRGSSLIINGCNNLSVSYRVDDGLGGFVTVSSGNIYSIPNDDTYRNYRFFYTPTTGIGQVLVDGVTIWSNDGPDNRDLYWTGAGDVIIGEGMDGTGFNDTFLDNVIVASIFTSPLPVQLISFNVEECANEKAYVSWVTKSERNSDWFYIERSEDGVTWERIGKRQAAGNSNITKEYNFTDPKPLVGLSYYRLIQEDFDGVSETFKPKSIVIGEELSLRLFPNPSSSVVNINYSGNDFKLFNASGARVQVEHYTKDNWLVLDVSTLPKGVYFITIEEKSARFVVH